MSPLIDIHCHLLPGVDDGAGSMKETIRMLKLEEKDGVGSIVFTPHHRVGMFETKRSVLDETFLHVQRESRKAGINISLHMGCEYHVTPWMLEDYTQGYWPTLAGSRFVLIEFDEDESFLMIKGRIMSLEEAGFRPVIAHAERIYCLLDKPERFSELKKAGAEMQLTAGAVLGEDGKEIAGECLQLIRQDKVQYIATDAHHLHRRQPDLGKCFRYVTQEAGKMKAIELMCSNPRKICGEENYV